MPGVAADWLRFAHHDSGLRGRKLASFRQIRAAGAAIQDWLCSPNFAFRRTIDPPLKLSA